MVMVSHATTAAAVTGCRSCCCRSCNLWELAGECRRNSVCPRFLISFVYLAVVISAFTLTIYFRVSSLDWVVVAPAWNFWMLLLISVLLGG
ncbi:hypothetical protein PIB30_094668 [Stylosanthes scabra]|uniref:Uncharacterized protein n=1 Tax=Stylosanthes scabra TaxID=79078 RepID=A0ABU6SWU0_9FABA|nr:hypothetical protein [Stylosanthes scabra]